MAVENSIEFFPGKQYIIPRRIPVLGGRKLFKTADSIVVHYHFDPGSQLSFGIEVLYQGALYDSAKVLRQETNHESNPPLSCLNVRYKKQK